MDSRPDISVIIPCHNAAQTVSETIESIRSQTLQSWEIVCVDDGSRDRTPELLDHWAGSDTRIRWTRVAHGGAAAARNHGVHQARGRRIFFLDADDLVRPDALERMLAAATVAGDRAVVTAGFELLDDRGRPLSVFRFPSVPGTAMDAFLRANRITSMSLVPAAVLGREPFDELLGACEDWDLWLRLAHAGVRYVALPRVLLRYRLRAGSLSHKADLNYVSGCRLLERWLPHAHEPRRVRDVPHRWACACGALALASGAERSVWRYFENLPPLEPTEDFCVGVAGSIDWAYLLVHGAAGQTWRHGGDAWLEGIGAWLRTGPIAEHAEPILECLRQVTRDPQELLNSVREFVLRRPEVERILVYGLGTNGLTLLGRLRVHPHLRSRELCVADDFAEPLTFDALGLPREDPRCWDRWPASTAAVITANNCRAMRETLRRAGGREGRDFIALTGRVEAPCSAVG